MIVDLLKFNIKSETADEAIGIFAEQMEDNLGDEGCLLSKTFRSKTNPGEFFMLLGWENQEAIEKHLVTEHDLLFREKMDPHLEGPPEFFAWEPIA